MPHCLHDQDCRAVTLDSVRAANVLPRGIGSERAGQVAVVAGGSQMRLDFAVRGRRVSGRRPERESRIAGRGRNAGEPNQIGPRARETRSTIQNHRPQSGFTLLELIIVLTILSVLTAAAVPMVRNTVVRERESELRLALRQLRQAIDRYKKLHDDTNGAAIPIEFKTQSGYPKELKVLEDGFIPANVVGTSS